MHARFAAVLAFAALFLTATRTSAGLPSRDTRDPRPPSAYLDEGTAGIASARSLASVPEPSAAWLFPIGLGLLAVFLRRNN